MKGLLLKDFYQTVKYCRAYLLIAVLFIGVSVFGDDNFWFILYPCIVSGMVPVTLLGYDERSKWCEYCGVLPYTKAQIVSGKYVIGLFAQAAVVLLAGIAQAYRMCSSGTFAWAEFCGFIAVLLSMSCMISAMALPVMFKFGVEKGRIAYYVMLGIVSALGAAVSIFFSVSDVAPRMNNNILFIGIFFGAAALYALSWYLSIVFYEKREG